MHYYQFNIGDYMRDTQHLDELEDLVYRRLLDLCYLSEAPLPLEIKEVARRIRMRSEIDRITIVLQEFFKETPEGWVNRRAVEAIEAYKLKSEKAKAAINSRWNKNKDLADTNVTPTNEGRTPSVIATNNHKPITKNQEPNKKTTTAAKAASSGEGLDWEPLGLSGEHVKAVKAIRAKHGTKGKISQRVITGLAVQFQAARNAGFTDEQIIGEWDLRGWIAVKAEWLIRDAARPAGGLGIRASMGEVRTQKNIQAAQDFAESVEWGDE